MPDRSSTDHFDYVIVGGGSAGCVLAGRLSEDRNSRVCLVEAGPEDSDPRIKVPLGVMTLMGNRRFDWRYQSEPHEHLGGRRVPVPRGKTLGGSGSINSMVYIRGRASDYDRWAEQGCTGWDWDSVLPWFRRSESNKQLGDDPLHGSDGPLRVEDLPSPHPMLENFVAAGSDLGIPYNRDFNGVTQEGIGAFQTTMRNGRRCSPADAYLAPARSRPNLHIITGCLVDRIEFDGRRAAGIRVIWNGQPTTIEVSGELLLSAGAIGSPAILLRSGVGPGEHLAELGIETVHSLDGVGRNLHEHPAVGVFYGGGRDGYALSFATLLQNALAPFRYVFARKGLFASNTVEGGGFARTRDDLDEPDVQFHFIPARVDHKGKTVTWGRGYYCDACVLKPESRGRLALASKDPNDAPLIDFNLLSEQGDRDTLLAGMKLVRRLLANPHLKKFDARELVPGPDVTSDDELMDVVKARLGTAYHPVGTCRMGAADDARSVVDPELRVIGLANVRVVDASVMPEIVAGNTNAPTMMIGEFAADKIRRYKVSS